MTTTITQRPEYIEIKISGKLDTLTAPDFQQATEELSSLKDSTIILECSELTYVSSSGLRSLLKLRKMSIANSNDICLQNVSAEILEVLNMTGFSALFTIK